MTAEMRLPLQPSREQAACLERLQRSFAELCNTLAPVVQERRLWHRVTLHHLMYRSLRESYPAVGSQMVCNAIYSVCRSARLVYQHPASPHLGAARLPLMRFSERSPVYFDRHTLAVKEGMVSLYTLEGRIRCASPVAAAHETLFRERRMREIVLERDPDGGFELAFYFAGNADVAAAPIPPYIQVQP